MKVILEPFNDTSFALKTLTLPSKIGRKTKEAPTTTNGIFDSKVLSRTHAEITFTNNKVCIQDKGSSNGCFINNIRVSDEAKQSDLIELKSGDVIYFGVDIKDKDGSILYKRVSCKILFEIKIDTSIDDVLEVPIINKARDPKKFGY